MTYLWMRDACISFCSRHACSPLAATDASILFITACLFVPSVYPSDASPSPCMPVVVLRRDMRACLCMGGVHSHHCVEG